MPPFKVGDKVIVDYSSLEPPQCNLVQYWKNKVVMITSFCRGGVIEVDYPSIYGGGNARHWPEHLKIVENQLLLFEL